MSRNLSWEKNRHGTTMPPKEPPMGGRLAQEVILEMSKRTAKPFDKSLVCPDVFEQTFGCQECGVKYTSQAALESHREAYHPPVEREHPMVAVARDIERRKNAHKRPRKVSQDTPKKQEGGRAAPSEPLAPAKVTKDGPPTSKELEGFVTARPGNAPSSVPVSQWKRFAPPVAYKDCPQDVQVRCPLYHFTNLKRLAYDFSRKVWVFGRAK